VTVYVRHPHQPETVDIKVVNGVFVKATHFPVAGMIAPQHAHDFTHLSYIAAGSARVFADDECLGEFRAPSSVVIGARVKHRFEITSADTVVLCIHNADRLENGEPPVFEEHHLVPNLPTVA
jgi:hypothetical protein